MLPRILRLPDPLVKKIPKVSLNDFEGKNLVVVFYPLDFSPVCSVKIPVFNEKVNSTRRLTRFERKTLRLLLSTVIRRFAHKAWSEHLGGVDFPLLADMNLEVSKKFGMALEEVGITNRGVIVIDKGGKVAFTHVEDAPPDNTLAVAEVLDELDHLN